MEDVKELTCAHHKDVEEGREGTSDQENVEGARERSSVHDDVEK